MLLSTSSSSSSIVVLMLLACVTVTSAAPEFPPAPERRSLSNPAAVNLGTAGNYALLTKAGITTTGVTSVTGDIGVSPIAATAMTGFGLILDSSTTFSKSAMINENAIVTGEVWAADYAAPTPATMTTAISDMEIAYTDAAGRTKERSTDGVEFNAGIIGGVTLPGGVHKWTTSVMVPENTQLTLSGTAEAVFIMQIAGGLNFMAGATVVLGGEAQAKNVFWQVAGAVTVLSRAHVEGNILCATAITFGAGAELNGRGLAQTAVTMIATTVVMPSTN